MRPIVGMAIAAWVATGCGAGSSRLAEQRTATLRQVLERYHTESKFPGAVAGAWFADGSTIVAAVGVADRDRASPMPPDALLHAGSVGKTLFAALALQLVGNGRIGLDEPVSRYLGDEAWYRMVPNAGSITVRMLLNHTTGISGYGSEFMSSLVQDPGRRRSPLDAVQSVAGAKPLFPAGTRFSYSDVNYQLLQLLEEKVTGRSAYVEIQQRVLQPLGLSRIVPADAKSIPGLVPGYAGAGFFLGFDAVMGDSGLILDPAFEGGGGGFVTNAGDLAQWMALFDQGKAFPDSLLPEVRRGVPAGQLDVGKDAVSGLGVEIVQTPLGPAYGHGGFFPGYLSLVLWYPGLGVSVAIQVNSSASDALARPLREVLEEAARALSPDGAKAVVTGRARLTTQTFSMERSRSTLSRHHEQLGAPVHLCARYLQRMPHLPSLTRTTTALLLFAMIATSLGAQAAPKWSVETHTGPVHELAFDVTQSTSMSVSISPDGRSIVFDLLGHIYEMPIEGGTAKRLTDGRSWNLFPRVSPDGRSIAFSSDRAGRFDVWTMDRQGSSLRNVSEGPGRTYDNVYRPAWSADGQRLYAVGQGDGAPSQLIAFDLRGGRQVLTSGGGMSTAEPELHGSRVFFERAGGLLYGFGFNPYVIPPSGTRIERYDQASGEIAVHIERPGGAFAPALSPDGRQLAYVHRAIDSTVLIVQDLATARERVVLRGLDRDRQQGSGYGPYPTLAWHPDGKRIFLGVGGQLLSIDVTNGKTAPIPFNAPVRRQMSETIRFTTREPAERALTRAARWASRSPQGVLFEALGDIWLAAADGTKRNLTQSDDNETSPVMEPKTGTLYYAAWSDDSLGGVYRTRSGGQREPLSRVPSQYGSLALSRDGSLAFVRGTGGLERGLWLSNESTFDLIVRTEAGVDRRITGITGQPLEYANIAGKIPPSVLFGPGGETLYFTEFERDTLVLKRIGVDGRGETVLFRFPNAVAAVPSPDLKWIAIREYQRSFITPFSDAGRPVTVSPFEGTGFAVRVDPEDGGYLTWSADGATLGWTRASGFYEKDVARILAEAESRPAGAAGSDWTGARVPGSTARRTDLAMEIAIDRPKGVMALTGVRIATMNPQREVLENATIIIEANRISALGTGVAVPAGAKVYDLQGHTVIPGLIDAHAHPHIEHSSLHVMEQRPTYLSGPLAYGVTTVVEVYGNEYRDGWLSDMVRAGRITGPRYFTTGSVIYGTRRGARLRMYRPIETLEDALEQLRWNKDHGAIAVKDYVQLTRKRRHLTATAARQLGLNMLSETTSDPQMNLTQLLDGVTGLEHTMGLAPFYDDVVRYWGGTKAGMTPTLLVVYNGVFGEGWYHGHSKLWQDPKLTRFITPEQLMRVRNPAHLWPEDMYAWTMGREIRKLYANGTSLQLGAHGQMFGLDAHWELDLLVRGGFTPAEALEIGTIRGATHHGLAGEIGSLEVGKFADLVVLEANPLEDIANATRIRYVMKNGILFAGADAARVWPDPKPAGKPYFVREVK